ncbi:hypothetical protein CLV96_4011 [Leptospira meyeri]|uniref:DUF2087 domain-containing protein n=1 Tax=Leptospira meyeri TaxID=29508 RepID=A0A4R8MM08_LEPME|nr:DUF2087 domain-containing protein [Leptospira meyeri]EKJ86140.1 PF09860 family protein [Leptospira meyeri serovar Hardjo str. Went 5]TDY65974.1 hypothetical protein CLV96_4011 [Leptospira meyeri]
MKNKEPLEKIDLTENLNLIKDSYLAIVRKYGKVPELLNENLNNFFSICIAAELRNFIETEYNDVNDIYKFVVISNRKTVLIEKTMILKNIRINYSNKNSSIQFISESGRVFNDDEYSLFLACTQTENIYLNSQNLALIKAYIPIKKLFTKDKNKLIWPRQTKLRNLILRFLSLGLEPNKKYSEKEINEYLSFYYNDFALLRRNLIDLNYLYRSKDGSIYYRHFV